MALFLGRFIRFSCPMNARSVYGRCRIGNRDVVGFGMNGSYNYNDSASFPFPAVRFKETTREIAALREKEKCDWRQLSCEEKKALYRASFCMTFAEFQAPTGSWKFVIGWGLVCVSVGIWMFIFSRHYSQTCTLEVVLRIFGLINIIIKLTNCQYTFDFPEQYNQPLMFLVQDVLPPHICKENQKAQLRRMLELHVNPIDGLSSKWDYDNDKWK